MSSRFEFIWDLALWRVLTTSFVCLFWLGDWYCAASKTGNKGMDFHCNVYNFEICFGLDLWFLIFHAGNFCCFIRENLLKGQKESSLLTFIQQSHGNYHFICVTGLTLSLSILIGNAPVSLQPIRVGLELLSEKMESWATRNLQCGSMFVCCFFFPILVVILTLFA